MKSDVMSESISLQSVVVATKQQVFGDLGEEAVILNLHDGVYYGVNSVGSRIWSQIQQPTSVGDLVAILTEEFEVGADDCQREVSLFLNQLLAKGLVEVTA